VTFFICSNLFEKFYRWRLFAIEMPYINNTSLRIPYSRLRKNNSMQTGTRLNQADHAGVCPLCNTPLSTRNISQTHNQHAQIMVVCTSCGFSGQFIQRQSLSAQAHSSTSIDASVWIDPAVEAYLKGHVVEAEPQHTPTLVTPQKYPQPNPNTPVPPRASAQSPQKKTMKVRAQYPSDAPPFVENNDLTRVPTLPPPSMWEYETPDYAIESSLSSLSLIAHIPTRPATGALSGHLKHQASIDEIDTLPPQAGRSPSDIDKIKTLQPSSRQACRNIDEIDTLPSPGKLHHATIRSHTQEAQTHASISVAPGIVRTPEMDMLEHSQATLNSTGAEPASWTAGGALASTYAWRIAEHSHKRQGTNKFHLLDHLRWWLLQPGRIEFLLWLVGTIILISITFTLLFAMAVSMALITPGQQPGTSGSTNTPGTDNNLTSVSNAGLKLTLLDRQPLVIRQALHVHGQGFSAHGKVIFTNERNLPVLTQNRRSNILQVDGYGTFIAILYISSWTAGQHMLVVRDMLTKHTVQFPIILAADPFGKNATPTAISQQPGATATQNSGPGVLPTPISSTPVPPKPSPITTPPPKPTPTQPSITPTIPATPGSTPTSTPGTTPTASSTP
jgi:RNase P subunit RPR2